MGKTRASVRAAAGLALSLARPLGIPRSGSLTVFCFHDVGDEPSRFVRENGLGVSTATFRRQIEWIGKNFDILHPGELDRAGTSRAAALITFDDGYAGSFANGIAWLEQQRIPSLMFLNMRSIVEPRPLLSAIALYLGKHSPAFRAFAASRGLSAPYHLSLSPRDLAAFEAEHGPVDFAPILEYQGKLGDLDTVAKWGRSELVAYGNHLYDHWNSVVLTDAEFLIQYSECESALASVGGSSGLFAFPNGRSDLCFSRKHVELALRARATRAFSADGRINPDGGQFLLDRITLGENDSTPNRLSFRVNRDWLRPSTQRAMRRPIFLRVKKRMRARTFLFLEKYARVHILPVHFTSPIPSVHNLGPEVSTKVHSCKGLDLNGDGQLAMMRDLFPKYAAEYTPAVNSGLSRVDAFVLYALVRARKPRTFIEIGAGESTLVTLRATERNAAEGFPCEVTAIDPYPPKYLREITTPGFKLVVSKVEDIPEPEFDGADILFIDSSHVAKVGSDVNYEILNLVPRVKVGALVHWHDIMIPVDYPASFFREGAFWNESYMVHAFMLFNSAFKTLWAARYAQIVHGDELRRVFPYFDPADPDQQLSSFWVERVS